MYYTELRYYKEVQNISDGFRSTILQRSVQYYKEVPSIAKKCKILEYYKEV